MASSLETIQHNLGVPVTPSWDAVTSGAIAPYQGGERGPLPMYPTGEPDPATLINLGYYDPKGNVTRDRNSNRICQGDALSSLILKEQK